MKHARIAEKKPAHTREDAHAATPYTSSLTKPTRTRKDTFITRTLTIVGVLLLLVALTIGGVLIFNYLDAQTRYHDIATVSGLQVSGEGNVVSSDLRLEDIVIDWDALRARNPDIVAWVIIPDTHINYPIVMGPDNYYYLTHLFDDTSNGTGTIFVDSMGSATLDDRNNLIYGHNMLDGSMFSDLIPYQTVSHLLSHQTIFLATPTRNYELRALATLRVGGDEAIRVFSFPTEEDFQKYSYQLFSYAIAKVLDFEKVRPGIETLYSFVTCDADNSYYRVIVTATPIRSIPAPVK